jgi:hypothetical protein
MEKIINRLIDDAVVDVDKYVNNNSTWLIFTESKQWVIELTKDGTLWYNYNFFKNLFVYMSMDVVENQHYITKWVEDNIINGVKHLRHRKGADDSRAENIIQNGVKIKPALESHEGFMMGTPYVDKFFSKEDVEDTVQNGVKETRWMSDWEDNKVEDTIQNGVKETLSNFISSDVCVEDIIQNGVKGTKIQELDTWDIQKCRVKEVEDIIQNVVKDTKNLQWMKTTLIEDTVQNGVKI